MKREDVARELVRTARELAGANELTDRHISKAERRVNSLTSDIDKTMDVVSDAQDALNDEDYDEDVDQYLVDAWNALSDAKMKVHAARKHLNAAARGI